MNIMENIKKEIKVKKKDPRKITYNTMGETIHQMDKDRNIEQTRRNYLNGEYNLIMDKLKLNGKRKHTRTKTKVRI